MSLHIGILGTLAALFIPPFIQAQTSQEIAAENAPACFFWGDFDGDGLDDAFVITPSAEGRLLKNRGDGTLEDVTQAAGLGRVALPRFAAWADLDRDLDLDLFVGTLSGRNHMLINEGGASFADVTESSGLAPDLALHAGFVDYDRDGLPDLHVQTKRESLLYHNLGAALFERVELALPSASPVVPAAEDPDELAESVTSDASPAPPASGETRGGKFARTPVAPVEVTTSMGVGGLQPAGTENAIPPGCAESVLNQSNTASCIFANTTPTLGQLYPISSNLYVDSATNRVGLGTVTPGARLHVVGSAIFGDTDVRGQLDLEKGGLFEMFDNTGAHEKVEFHPDNVGGASLSMRNEAGNTSVFLDSDWANFGDARLMMENAAGVPTIDLDAGTFDDAAELNVTNAAGTVTIQLDGDTGTGGAVQLFNNAGVRTADLQGDNVGFLTLKNTTSAARVFLDGGATDGGADMDLIAADGSFTVFLDADDINDAGFIQMRNDATETTVEVFGDNANDAGRINLWDRNGSTVRNSVLINARDFFGTGSEVVLLNQSGTVGIDLDAGGVSTGALTIAELDGSAALEFFTDDLTLRNSAGLSTINFDRQLGTKSAVVDTPSYGERLFYAMEAPEVWFEDFGTARLVNGEARIELDPIFLESVTIGTEHPMKVFVTPDGLTSGLYVEKGLDHFVVREQPGGSGSVGFDWRVVAKRSGLEALRLDPFDPPRDESDPLDRAWMSEAPVDGIEGGTGVPEYAPKPSRTQASLAPAVDG